MSDQFSSIAYFIKSVMCKLILTKTKFRSLNVYEIEVILPSPLTEDFSEEKKLWKGMLFSDNTYILFGCRLLVCIANWLSELSEWTIYPSKPRCYGDCMLLVKKTNVNSKNKQDPNPSRYFLQKDSNVFNGFHHYSQYIDYFSINCVPQLQGKGRVVSDPPVQIKHLDHRQKKSRKCWY